MCVLCCAHPGFGTVPTKTSSNQIQYISLQLKSSVNTWSFIWTEIRRLSLINSRETHLKGELSKGRTINKKTIQTKRQVGL